MSSDKCDMHMPMEFHTPGVPPNPLPFWADFSLMQKLPVPSRPPKGTVVLFNSKLGHSRWIEKPTLDFDLTDPHNYNYPATKEYDSRYDRNLRGYFSSRRVFRHLRSHGLVNPDRSLSCSLHDYNRYRMYMHSLEMKIVKTKRDLDEPRLIQEMMEVSLKAVEEKKDGDDDLKIQYSEVLRNEVKSIMADNDQEIIEHFAKKGYPAGELRWLRWLNRILQEDCRRIALMRVRRIQKYGEMERKKWVDWRRRNIFDMEWLAEQRIIKADCEYESKVHTREHLEYIKSINNRMHELIRKFAEARLKSIREKAAQVQRHVCIRSHRQWPLSARCPKGIASGPKPCRLKTVWEKRGLQEGEGFDDIHKVMSDEAVADALEQAREDHIAAVRAAAARAHKKDGGKSAEADESTSSLPPYHRPAHRADSLVSLLTEHIIINAMDIIARTRKEHGHHLERIDPAIEPDKVITGIECAVNSEMECLAADEPDVLLMIADRITNSVMTEKTTRDKLADWDSAPQLRTSSSKTGLYVANTIAEVFGQLKDEGLLTPGMRELAAGSSVARGATEMSLHSHIDDVAALRGGEHMLDLAVGVLRQKHKSLPDGDDDQHWKELGAGLVASLVRIAIVQVRDALQHGHVGDTDLEVLVRTMVHAAAPPDEESYVPSAHDEVQHHGKGHHDDKHHGGHHHDHHGDDHHGGHHNDHHGDDHHGGHHHDHHGNDHHHGGHHQDKHAALQMAQHGKLITSESITRMITDAVQLVAAESKDAHIDAAVRKHIAHAAQQFIARIIDGVLADRKK